MRLVWLLALVAAVLSACSGGDDAVSTVATTTLSTQSTVTTSTDTTTEAPPPVTASQAPATTGSLAPEPEPQLPPQLNGQFEVREVTVDGQSWIVAIADTPALRSQGLMNVTDLLDLDGMVFVWQEEVQGSFWMKDTLIPLDIAFFDGDGAVVAVLTMQPCVTDSCEQYSPGIPFRYALEARSGALSDLADGARLEVN
jgi:uncharacterized membrane protein (UPF0127 family)